MSITRRFNGCAFTEATEPLVAVIKAVDKVSAKQRAPWNCEGARAIKRVHKADWVELWVTVCYVKFGDTLYRYEVHPYSSTHIASFDKLGKGFPVGFELRLEPPRKTATLAHAKERRDLGLNTGSGASRNSGKRRRDPSIRSGSGHSTHLGQMPRRKKAT